MIAPGRVTDVKRAGSELFQELSDDAEGACAGEGLHRGHFSVTDHLAVEAEDDSLGTLAEFIETVNW